MGTEESWRRACAQNLSNSGRAMILYSNDYEDQLAKSGGLVNDWVPTIPNWAARTRRDAFALTVDRASGTTVFPTGKITTTSSLYLLVKYAEVPPATFVCPGEPKTLPFSLSEVKEKLPASFEFIDAWDFGGRYDDANNPSTHCSYSYHMPFDRMALAITHPPGVAVLADRNPWIDPKRVHDATLGWAQFMAASGSDDPNRVRLGNSDAHRREGQNVLFLDTHVAFEKRPACGVNDDNIYTIDAGPSPSGRPGSTVPQVYGPQRPAHRDDSVLVQELPYILRGTPAPEAKP